MELKYYGGEGYLYLKEMGNFEVKAKESKEFIRLS
jgi:hypothetical protein